MATQLIEAPNTKELEADIDRVIAEAQAVVIATREDYDACDREKAALSEKEKRGLLLFNGTEADPGPCTLAHRTWKAMVEMRDRVVGRYSEAKKIRSLKMGTWWDADQVRIRKEQAAREEQARKDEAARLKAEGATKKEIKDVASGKTAIPMPPAPVAAPTIGRKPVDYWSARVVDKMALVKAVAAGKVPLTALEPNMVYLNATAKQLKAEFRCAGCEVVKETRA